MDNEWFLSWNAASGGFLLLLLEIVHASNNGLWDKDSVRAVVRDAERYIDSIEMPERASPAFLRWSGWERELLAIIHLKLVDNPATIAQYGSIPDVLIDSPVANPTEAMPQANPYTITTDSFGDVMRKYKHAIENTDDVPKKWKDMADDMQKHNVESLGEMLTNLNRHFVVRWAKSRSITLRGNHESVAHWWNRLGRASQIEIWHFANYNMV